MQTIQEFIATHQLTMSSHRVQHRPDNLMDMRRGRHFLCTIKQEGKGNPNLMTLFFSQGSAHKKGPTLADVLCCIASDASSIINSRGFEDWAGDLGYDTDSRKAEDIYKACTIQLRDLERLLGRQAVQDLAFEVERL